LMGLHCTLPHGSSWYQYITKHKNV
jgi:hypothetical protein